MRYYILKLPCSNPNWCREPKTETINPNDYVPVWTDEIEVDPAFEIEHTLEKIFSRFNMDIPDHYAASSMSTGDIILLQDGDKLKYYLCCHIGWKRMETICD